MGRTKFQVGDLLKINTSTDAYWRYDKKVVRVLSYENRRYTILADRTGLQKVTITAGNADFATNNREVHEYEQWEQQYLASRTEQEASV